MRCAVLFILASLALAGSIQAYVDYQEIPHWIIRDSEAHSVSLAARSDSVLLAVDDALSLATYDASDPTNPELLDKATLLGATDVAVYTQDYAVVAALTNGLVICDCSDPSDLQMIASVSTSDNANAVAIQGDYAIVAESANSQSGHIEVFDLSDPDDPVLVKSIQTTYGNWDVAVDEDYAFVASTNAVLILDVSVPSQSYVVSSASPSVQVSGVAMAFPYGYVTCPDEGELLVLDASRPASPRFRGTLDLPGIPDRVMTKGGICYLSCGQGGIVLADVSDPDDPVEILRDGIPLAYGNPDNLAMGMTMDSREFLYLGLKDAGLAVYDVSGKDEPPIVTEVTLPGTGQAYDVELHDGYAYVAHANTVPLLRVVDLSSHFIVGSFPLPDGPNDVDVVDMPPIGTVAFVAAGDSGIVILNTELPPDSSSILGRFSHPDSSGFYDYRSLAAMEEHVYAATGWHGLEIIDVTDPADPVLVGALNLPGYSAVDVAVDSLHAYVCDDGPGNGEFFICDVSDATSPYVVSSLDIRCSSVDVQDEVVYVVDIQTGRLTSIDVEDAENPVVLDSIELDYPGSVALSDRGHAYVTSVVHGTLIVDTSVPSDLRVIGMLGTGDAVAHDAEDGVLAVAGVGELVLAPEHNLNGKWGGGPALGRGARSLGVSRLWAEPNPTTGHADLGFLLAEGGEPIVEIFDLGGRRISTIPGGRMAAGEHRLLWDGRDAEGRRVANGIYLTRVLLAGKIAASGSIIVLQ